MLFPGWAGLSFAGSGASIGNGPSGVGLHVMLYGRK